MIPLLAVLLLAGVPGAAPGSSPTLHRLRLANGLRVLVVPRGDAPWCAVATVLPGGSLMDPAGRSGLAHLAEHLLFEDAPGDARSDAQAERLGMLSNAFTLEEYTVVVEEFSPAVMEPALGVHARRLGARPVSVPQLQREKRVVADERRFRVDEPPLGAADERLLSLLWLGAPRGRPVLGWPAEVESISVDDVTGWMQRTLHPGRAVTVVVGAVDVATLTPMLERTLGRWSSSAAVPTAQRAMMAAAGTRRDAVVGREGALLVALPAAPRGSPEAAADAVLARLLQGAPNEMGGAPLEVEVRAGHTWGVVVVTARADAEDPPGEAMLDAALKQVVQGAFPDEALAAARTATLWSEVRSVQTHAFLAERLAADEALLGSAEQVHKVRVQLESVRAGDIRARARAWQTGARAVVQVRMDAP